MSVARKKIMMSAGKHLLLVVAMFGFGYLMVPMYNVICDVVGLNGKTGRIAIEDASSATVDNERMVTVEFVGIINGGWGWEFTPTQYRMDVQPGKLYKTSFHAKNLREEGVVGQAVPSVAPSTAAKYFNKTECFCFTRQEFEAGGARDMPLVFVVDPKLPKTINTLTLSYTFFDTGESAKEI